VNDLHYRDYTIEFGNVDQYRVDLSEFEAATALDPGDTQGTEGDDDLQGGTGDDNLSGGDGDDNFTTSGGDDVIDGGSGHDTLNVFGARYHFNVSGNGTTTTLTDSRNLEGSVTMTGVERVFFVTD